VVGMSVTPRSARHGPYRSALATRAAGSALGEAAGSVVGSGAGSVTAGVVAVSVAGTEPSPPHPAAASASHGHGERDMLPHGLPTFRALGPAQGTVRPVEPSCGRDEAIHTCGDLCWLGSVRFRGACDAVCPSIRSRPDRLRDRLGAGRGLRGGGPIFESGPSAAPVRLVAASIPLG
jgi:hypothetical protein